jgi:hypothetical protein
MTNTMRRIRLLATTAIVGVGMGAAAAAFTTPLNATVVPVDEPAAKGHGHIEPDGVYFCHCSGTACTPCAST